MCAVSSVLRMLTLGLDGGFAPWFNEGGRSWLLHAQEALNVGFERARAGTRFESFDRLSITTHQEFRKIPFDILTAQESWGFRF